VPLGVTVGSKLPHWALPQVTDHVTPAFALSLLTVAVNAAVALVTTEVGGAFRVTDMGAFGAEIVIVAVADLVESVTDVAITVTVAGLGTALGAEYFVAAPLPVEVAERLPQPEPPQETDHFTPALALSLLTTAVRLVDEPALIEDGG
jgi:hypothetical protein